MASSKLSHKYQIVIPKAVREKMRLRLGSVVTIRSIDEKHALIVKHPKDYVTTLKGLGKDVWQNLGGVSRYIKQERGSWKK